MLIQRDLQWMFERQGNGNFWIKSASGLYLRVEGGVGNGAKVEVGLMQYDWKIQDDSSVHQGIRCASTGISYILGFISLDVGCLPLGSGKTSTFIMGIPLPARVFICGAGPHRTSFGVSRKSISESRSATTTIQRVTASDVRTYEFTYR